MKRTKALLDGGNDWHCLRGDITLLLTQPETQVQRKLFSTLIPSTMFSPSQLDKLIKILRRKNVDGKVYKSP